MTEEQIATAIEKAATELGARSIDVQGYYAAGGDWDASSVEELSELICECWREQQAAL